MFNDWGIFIDFVILFYTLQHCVSHGLDTKAALFFLSLQITKQQLQTTKDRFESFLKGDTQIVADEAFINAVQSYYEVQTKSIMLFSFTELTTFQYYISFTVVKYCSKIIFLYYSLLLAP